MIITTGMLKLLETVRERPGLYVHPISLIALDNFLGGYSFKEHEIDVANRDRFVCMRGFGNYVRLHYGLDLTAKGCFRMIAENTESDEEGFYKFFELLDSYKLLLKDRRNSKSNSQEKIQHQTPSASHQNT